VLERYVNFLANMHHESSVSDRMVAQTVFSSIVVNHLQQRYGSGKCPVICLYLNYKEASSQTCRNLLASLLKQLIQLQPNALLPAYIRDWYEKARRSPPKEKYLKQALASI
jgi:hypothetical protein